jgi:hypothetical protein
MRRQRVNQLSRFHRELSLNTLRNMSDTIDQQIHDLLDESHLLFLSMALPGPIDQGKANGLIARVRRCAEQAATPAKAKVRSN